MIMVFPLGKLVFGYSPLGERVGGMIVVFPLGKLVYGYSSLGERVGLHDFSPLGRG